MRSLLNTYTLLKFIEADKSALALTLEEVACFDHWLEDDWGIRFPSDCQTIEDLLRPIVDRTAVSRFLTAHDEVANQILQGTTTDERQLYEYIATPAILGAITSQRRHFILDTICLGVGLARAVDAQCILDVGCHAGFVPDLLERALKGTKVVGIDPCVPAIELARARTAGRTNLHFEATALPWDSGNEFDIAQAIDVIPQNSSSVVAFLRSLAEVLRPGGLALISSPYWMSADIELIQRQVRLAGFGFGYADVVGGYGGVPPSFDATGVVVLVKGGEKPLPRKLKKLMESEWPQFRNYANATSTAITSKTQAYERANRKVTPRFADRTW